MNVPIGRIQYVSNYIMCHLVMVRYMGYRRLSQLMALTFMSRLLSLNCCKLASFSQAKASNMLFMLWDCCNAINNGRTENYNLSEFILLKFIGFRLELSAIIDCANNHRQYCVVGSSLRINLWRV